MLADSLIERECQSLIMHASNSSLVTIQLLLTLKSGPSSCLVTASLNKWCKRKLKKNKFSSLLFPLSLLQKLTQQWSWAMLACNLHSKHCNVTQNLYLLPVQPRFGALHNPRWHCDKGIYGRHDILQLEDGLFEK